MSFHLPHDIPLIIDAEGADFILKAKGNNKLRSDFFQALSEGRIFVCTAMLKHFREVCPECVKEITEHGIVRIRPQEVESVAGELIDHCHNSGIEVSEGLAPKIYTIAAAKVKGGRVLSADGRKSSISMKSLCTLFSVAFVELV